MLQDLQAPSPYAIGRHGSARSAMLTHLYRGYNGETHLSFAVHLTQVRHTSQLADKCDVSDCLSQLCCLPGKVRQNWFFQLRLYSGRLTEQTMVWNVLEQCLLGLGVSISMRHSPAKMRTWFGQDALQQQSLDFPSHKNLMAKCLSAARPICWG